MAKEVVLPELAESVVEGEILKWLVEEGQAVALEQPLCEVMTDKVTVELPSPVAGTLSKRLVQEGDVVAVHAPIALIEEVGADVGVTPEQGLQASAENPGTTHETLPVTAQEERSIVEVGGPADAGDESSLFSAFAEEETVRLPGSLRGAGGAAVAERPAVTQPTPQVQGTARADGRVLAVPAARQLARELGIDISRVPGSGPNGRVRVLDVHQYAAARQAPASSKPTSGNGLPVVPVQYKTPKGYEDRETRTPLRGLRRAISQQMLASHLYTVRTLTVDEANLTRLVALRARLKDELAADGVKLTYLPFIFKAIAVALAKYPSLNTSLDEATQEIVQRSYVNIGMAVATDAGLIVPVIRDVERRSLVDLARAISDVATRATSGQLKPDEMGGSSFSVTNIGSIGALFSFPIINVPDAAILGVHSIVKRPVYNERDELVPAHMMYLSLSFDHRLVDGAEAARFCREVIRLLENPERLLLEA